MSLSSFTRRLRLPALLVVTVLLLAACGGSNGDSDSADGGGDTQAADATNVVIDQFKFQPPDIQVSAGTTVTWTNKDSAAHSVKDKGGLFPESERIDEGASFSYTYEEPGVYPYVCGIHSYMTGTVTVS